MKLPEIIGVAGTNGAGKDTLAILRAENLGAANVSLSDMLRSELANSADHERGNLREFGNKLRAEFGPGVLAERAIKAYRESGNHTGLSITSVRSIGEAEVILAEGGEIVWIDADPHLRHQRVLNRPGARPTDQKTFEEFMAEEAAEMNPPAGQETEKGVLNMGAIKKMATIFITNEFPDPDVYKAYLESEYELKP